LVLGVPVTDFWRFLLLTTAVIAICFGQARLETFRWLIGIAFALITAATLAWLLPGPRIEEGHNVYIPIGASREILSENYRQMLNASCSLSLVRRISREIPRCQGYLIGGRTPNSRSLEHWRKTPSHLPLMRFGKRQNIQGS